MTLKKTLLICLLSTWLSGTAQPADQFLDTLAYKQALLARKTALELEISLVQKHPDAYYLVLDIPAGQIELKSGANLLHTCPISGGSIQAPVQYYRFTNRIDPQTPEPGNGGLRHRGRRLPLDFVGRLVEGPRRASCLYFTPPLILKARDVPSPAHIPHLELSGADVKALGAALQSGSRAILIPPIKADSDRGSTR